MDIAYEVAEYLASSGFGTVRQDIYVGQIPEDTNGLYIVRAGGTPNNYVPIEETVLDIYCKNISSSSCISTLEDIKRFIHRMHTSTTNSAFVYTFLVLGDIEDVQRDLEYAKIYKITLQVVHRDKSLIS